jgi:DNA polymerase-3 subunit epsilon
MVSASMGLSLRELDVLLIDCQAGGATPAYGDLLEIGWGFCDPRGPATAVQGHWIQPRTERRITRAVRELTGWSEACVAGALPEAEAWSKLITSLGDRRRINSTQAVSTRWPTLIHYARFELTFLHDLHQRIGVSEEFPLEIQCLHAIAARLFPDLPRRNIRALAGFLGHSPELMRRVTGHVEASAFIWRALIPQLEAQGVLTWSDLTHWLATAPKAARSRKRTYPLALERRRSLPDRPGVYRFVRSNGSVLYVGKAASLKKRIAGHFSSRGPSTERGLELLSQVHDIVTTETASVLEAALLETDEIKRLDPPYNVQLRSGQRDGERSAWYATRDLSDVLPRADAQHSVGPLPSQRALSSLAALCALVDGAEATPALCAQLLGVPSSQLPAADMFQLGFAAFMNEQLAANISATLRRVTQASLALFLARGRVEPEATEPSEPNVWDLARVRRRLERALLSGGLLLRRARVLTLLADCDLAYREVAMTQARALTLQAGQLANAVDIVDVFGLQQLEGRSTLPRSVRLQCIDAAAYDRLRVLTTEINRVLQEGGELAVRIGGHCYSGTRAAGLFSHV